MTNISREERIKAHEAMVATRLARIATVLAGRQIRNDPYRGNVPASPNDKDPDFHGTLAAIWIWSRLRALSGSRYFDDRIRDGWAFVKEVVPEFLPNIRNGSPGDEVPYDCAMTLRVLTADAMDRGKDDLQALSERAVRLLVAYLSDLDDFHGRAFEDPGFLAWSLADYAHAVDDRRSLSVAHKFVERAFGMKRPPVFSEEVGVADDLFDFSATTATRILAVVAVEGATPFVGAWLRERVAPVIPKEFVSRPLDENTWNACVAVTAGQSYVVSTDPVFFDVYQTLLKELERRMDATTYLMGRHPGLLNETLATFYYALALNALLHT